MRDLRKWPSLLLAPLHFRHTLAYPAQTPLLPSTHPTPTPANYTGYELRRYGISNRQDLIHMIQTFSNDNIDIWQLTPNHVDVHMDTTHLSDALSNRTYVTLPYSFPYSHAYQTVPVMTTETTPVPLPNVSSLQNSTFHGAYHTVEEIELFVAALASTYPKLVEVVWLGGSWENRDVFAIRIGKRGGGKRKKGKKGKQEKEGAEAELAPGRSRGGWGRRRGRTLEEDLELMREEYRSLKSFFSWLARRIWGSGTTDAPSSIRGMYVDDSATYAQSHRLKDRVVIQGAQHAREWIATSTALYLAHALVAPKNESGSLQHLLDQTDFTIIPVPNPDGYAYTWSTDRLWYKNRMDVLPGNNAPRLDDCKGIDMNRNWGYEWNPSGKNVTMGPDDPCSHWYPGAYPFQAPEVTAIANYIRRTPKIRAFVDLRSYGQKLMYPYSFSCDQIPPHAEDIIEAALGATKALRETHNVPYTSGASCELLYPAPGNIIDWMYGDAKVKYSYSLMLRDTGTYGFMLPPRWIQPVGEETAAAVHSLVKFIGDVD